MALDEFHARLSALLPEGVRVEALLRFRDDVLLFNRGRNLVSRSGGQALVERMILESASAAQALALEAQDQVLDLGTGAGFPGIPFAIARTVPGPVALLDRRPVACDFLRREVIDLELEGVEVLEGQSKELLAADPGLGGRFDWVLMKAVAPPLDALRLARPFLALGGRAVLFRDQDFRPDPKTPSETWGWEGGVVLGAAPTSGAGAALQLFRRLA